MRTITFLIISMMVSSCAFPYYGHRQVALSNEPMQILDKDSGKQIDKAVIIPRYTDLKSGAVFIAHSFIYNQGSRFHVYQPKALVFVVWPYWWFGPDIRIDGYVVCANGYEPAWSGLNGQYEADFKMHRRILLIKRAENGIYYDFIKAIQQPIIKTKYSRLFDVAPEAAVEIRNELTSFELDNISKIMDAT